MKGGVSMSYGALAVPGVLFGAAIGLALWTYSLVKQEKAARRDTAFTDKGLFESGKEAADERKRSSSSSGLAAQLRKAGVDDPPVMWVAGIVVSAFLLYALASTVSGSVLVGAAVGAVSPLGAGVRIAGLQKKRRDMLDRQFASMLPQVAANVRSSLTLERALRAAAAHVEEPLREEVGRVLADVAYGAALPESLERMAQRTGNPDMKAFAAAVRIQQRFGGSVSSVLEMIAAHANARLKAARELRTEVAGTRLAKWFVAAAMPVMFLIMYATNADFAHFYLTEPLGWAVLGVAVASEVFGLVACQHITSLEKEIA